MRIISNIALQRIVYHSENFLRAGSNLTVLFISQTHVKGRGWILCLSAATKNMGEKSKKITNKAQYERFVDIMKEKPDVARGFSKRPLEEINTFWKRITEELNSLGPPSKDPTSWKKVWSDYKSYLKKKLSQNKVEINATGGGRYKIKQFNPLEEEVICLLNLKCSIEGIGSKVFGVPSRSPEVADVVLPPLVNVDSDEINLLPPDDDNLNLPPPDDDNVSDLNQNTSRKKKELSAMDLLRKQVTAQERFFCDIIKSLGQMNKNILDFGENIKEVSKSLDKLQYTQKKMFEETCRYNSEVESEKKRHNQEIETIINSKLEIKKRILDIELMKLDYIEK